MNTKFPVIRSFSGIMVTRSTHRTIFLGYSEKKSLIMEYMEKYSPFTIPYLVLN